MQNILNTQRALHELHPLIGTAIGNPIFLNQRGSSLLSLIFALLISLLSGGALIIYAHAAFKIGVTVWTRANLEEARAKLRLHVGCSQLKQTLATACVPGTTLSLKDKNSRTFVLPNGTTTLSGKRVRALCSATGDSVVPQYQLANLSWANLFQVPFACAEPPATPTPTPTPSVTDHIIFVTSTTHRGDFGGLAAADSQCKTLATDAGVRADRPWKAVLSSSTKTALSRLPINGPIKDVKGNVVHSNTSPLFPSTGLARPVTYQENGLIPSSPLGVWTGTLESGTSASNHCSNWTDSDKTATQGQSNASGTTWIKGTTADCDSSRRLYCVSF